MPIPPTRELTDFKAVGVLSGLTAGPTALADEPLDQQRIASEDSTCFSGIKHSTDVCERLCLIRPVKDSRHRF